MKNKPEWLDEALSGVAVETYGGHIGHVVLYDAKSDFPLTIIFDDGVDIEGVHISAARYTKYGDMASGSRGEYPVMSIKCLNRGARSRLSLYT